MARGSQVPKDKQQLNWNVYVEDIIFRTVGKRKDVRDLANLMKMETFFVVGGAKEGKNILRRREFFETLLTVGCA